MLSQKKTKECYYRQNYNKLYQPDLNIQHLLYKSKALTYGIDYYKLLNILKYFKYFNFVCLSNPQSLLYAQVSSFSIQTLSLTRSVRSHLVTFLSLCSTCVIYGAPTHFIDYSALPNQPIPREAEAFPTGGVGWGVVRGDCKYFEHVSLTTYLIYFHQLFMIQIQILIQNININPSPVLNQPH